MNYTITLRMLARGERENFEAVRQLRLRRNHETWLAPDRLDGDWLQIDAIWLRGFASADVVALKRPSGTGA